VDAASGESPWRAQADGAWRRRPYCYCAADATLIEALCCTRGLTDAAKVHTSSSDDDVMVDSDGSSTAGESLTNTLKLGVERTVRGALEWSLSPSGG